MSPRGPPGTYYYSSAEDKALFWNMFDQVLVRPDLLNTFEFGNLKILTNDGSTNLANSQGRPDRNKASDHFPLLFRLNL